MKISEKFHSLSGDSLILICFFTVLFFILFLFPPILYLLIKFCIFAFDLYASYLSFFFDEECTGHGLYESCRPTLKDF